MGRKTPVRGTQLVGHGWSSLNTLDEDDTDIGDEVPYFGEGFLESGILARGARWADAEVSDDDDLRTHLDTLDSSPRDRSPATAADRPICSLAADLNDRTEGRVTPGSCAHDHSVSVSSSCLGCMCSVAVSRVHSNVSRAHSSIFSFTNSLCRHNRGSVSVHGRAAHSSECASPPCCADLVLQSNSCDIDVDPHFSCERQPRRPQCPQEERWQWVDHTHVMSTPCHSALHGVQHASTCKYILVASAQD